MKKYEIKINDLNRIIFFKNREVRTPTIIEVYEPDLESVKSSLRMKKISYYVVNEKIDFINIDEIQELVFVDKEKIIEELEEINNDKPKTILDKLVENGEIE